MYLQYTVILPLVLLVGCAGMHFTTERSFIKEMNGKTELWVAGTDFPITAGDRGRAYRTYDQVLGRTPASRAESQATNHESSLINELRWKESRLSYLERSKYEDIKWELGGVSDRIYYLDLSPYERQEYILAKFPKTSREVVNTNRRPSSTRTGGIIGHTIGSFGSEISINMGKGDVIERWGRPSKVDIAGNPSRENERWIFYRGGSQKIVYFENGRVQGWNTME